MHYLFALILITVITAGHTPEPTLFAQDKVVEGLIQGDVESKPKDNGPDLDKIKVEEVPQVVKQEAIKEVFMIVNESDINKVLIVSVDGRWISDARGVTVKTNIGQISGKPTVECMMYKGLFKPTKPETKKWTLASIITADNTEFQKILDGLQRGEFTLPE